MVFFALGKRHSDAMRQIADCFCFVKHTAANLLCCFKDFRVMQKKSLRDKNCKVFILFRKSKTYE